MNVSDAIASRHTVRAFKSNDVPLDLIKKILNEARYSPSSGNLQPWKVYVVHGQIKNKLSSIVTNKFMNGKQSLLHIISKLEIPTEFDIHPKNMKTKFPKYQQRLEDMAKDIYGLQGISRNDAKGRMEHDSKNFDFFGAPIGLFIAIDVRMAEGNYPDLGTFIAFIMLLCEQYGLQTCGQVAWSIWNKTLRDVLNIPKNELVFCGISVGYRDDNAIINTLRTKRMTFDELVVIPKLTNKIIPQKNQKEISFDGKKLISVSEAIKHRHSVREFSSKYVSINLIKKILNEARYAPSSCDLQPWKVYLLYGKTRDMFCSVITDKSKKKVFGDGPHEFQVWPNDIAKELPEYLARYQKLGAAIYGARGIARNDTVGRIKKGVSRNWQFFGAPVGLIFTIDRGLSIGQYPDLGIFTGFIMLLCEQYGLQSCAQISWSLWNQTIRDTFNIPYNEKVYCGMSIGYKDENHKVNKVRTERMKLEEFVIFPQLSAKL